MAVRLTLFGALLISMISCGLTCTMTDPCANQLGQGASFAEPAQEQSNSASWSITLNVQMASIEYDWLTLMRRTYNGAIVGPTWTVKQGDTLTVDLNNQLSEVGNNNGNPLNDPNYPNSTNLHTHGLHISSQDPQDNVLKHVEPGQTNRYIYQIHAQQPPGTYWYHAHLHGSTMFQVHSGLSGMLIVADNVADMPQELADVSCPNNCAKDVQLLFQPILMFAGNRGFGALQDSIQDSAGFQHDSYILDGTADTTLTTWLSQNVNSFTTNGQLTPELTMTTGEMYRFRLVNAGGDASLELYITDSSNVVTSNCEIREIAVDGVYLDAPRAMHDAQTFLTPASKVDWMVKCNTAGSYKLRSAALNTHTLSIGAFTRYTGDLLIMTVSGTSVTPVRNFPTTLPSKPSFLRDLRSLNESEIGGRFVVELNPAVSLNRELWSGPTNYRYAMKLGTVQEWHLLNTDTTSSHPLHIHVNHFQIISYNNYTGGVETTVGNTWQLNDINDLETACHFQREGYNATARKRRSIEDETVLHRVQRQGGGGGGGGGGQTPAEDTTLQYWGHETRFAADAGDTLGYSRLGDWRDIVLVPPLANITVRFEVHEFTGDVIIHCHILTHEDSGMMMIVKAVNDGESTDANITSGGAYPGTCRQCDRYPFNNATRLCDSGAMQVSSTILLVAIMSALAALLFDVDDRK